MNLKILSGSIEGEIHEDLLSRSIYSTDASVYKEEPLAVAIPRHEDDLQKIIRFCYQHQIAIIPRAAGTSLAGQCVGSGMVVDISKHFKKIYDLDVHERTVWVEPGVIRDELNDFLKPHGLHFGPNTSTANRCMIGGMVGNNSCGSSSIMYGSTRDHVLEMKVLLSNGDFHKFSTPPSQIQKDKNPTSSFAEEITQKMKKLVSDANIQHLVGENFPHPEIKRRNTGYALDSIIEDFNLCKLLAGSEGTLAFTTAVKLSLDPLPGRERVVICPHFNSVNEAMLAVPLIMSFRPDMCELMDKVILDCTKANKKQEKNRFFLEGDPKAVLMVQFNRTDREQLLEVIQEFEKSISEKTFAYAIPQIFAPDDLKVFELRAAGLGVLANLPGDPKAVACIEDTAVRIEDLADYIADFEAMMKRFGQKAVFYAHAGAGEIHLRPILDLKKQRDVELFRKITHETALLVKKYKGSLSGEHGDGRVRAEFIPLMVGEELYEVFREIKRTWDPFGIMNPGKIVDAAPLTSSLRYEPEVNIQEPETLFRFSEAGGIIRAVEKCNGSGDCRKLPLSGGTMCPSYQATRDEKDSTRARANALRNFLSYPVDQEHPFNSKEVKEALDLCLSCKACGTECPSNVDMTILKAEFLHQYYKNNGTPLRSRLFALINDANKLGYRFRTLTNAILQSKWFKRRIGIATSRNLPKLNRLTLRKFIEKNDAKEEGIKSVVYLFIDEFTNYNDESVGQKSYLLLRELGYDVKVIDHPESGRAAFSKGLLKHAKECADVNVELFSTIISEKQPLIGIEPSAILGFRDEYPQIVSVHLIEKAKELAKHTFTIEEFLFREIERGKITSAPFDKEDRKIFIHSHCHQKASSSEEFTAFILGLPVGHSVEIIPSGCCGMAGSFGYEEEHYEISMKIGEQTLFPALRKIPKDALISAAGTSCRHQIVDGVDKRSFHPAEILYDALK